MSWQLSKLNYDITVRAMNYSFTIYHHCSLRIIPPKFHANPKNPLGVVRKSMHKIHKLHENLDVPPCHGELSKLNYDITVRPIKNSFAIYHHCSLRVIPPKFHANPMNSLGGVRKSMQKLQK